MGYKDLCNSRQTNKFVLKGFAQSFPFFFFVFFLASHSYTDKTTYHELNRTVNTGQKNLILESAETI